MSASEEAASEEEWFLQCVMGKRQFDIEDEFAVTGESSKNTMSGKASVGKILKVVGCITRN